MENLKLIDRRQLRVDRNIRYISVDPSTNRVYLANKDQLFGYNLATGAVWTVTIPSGDPFPSYERITGLEALQGDNRVCVSHDNGCVISVDVETRECELESMMTCRCLSMAWSNDQELVLLATDLDKIVCLTRGNGGDGGMELVQLGDVDLKSSDDESGGFGEKEFQNVGWGKKETQFHGKGGKENEEEVNLRLLLIVELSVVM